jgi:hypothetical protein
MIGFCHIPKTGGTSLVQGMRDAGMNVWVPTPPEGVEPWDVTDWQQEPPKGTDVVAGHISSRTFDQFPQVTYWVTIIRQPDHRWYSHYYWLNRHVPIRHKMPPANLMSHMLGSVLPDEVWDFDELDHAAGTFGIEDLPSEHHKESGWWPGHRDTPPSELVWHANALDRILWWELNRGE